MPDWCYDHAPPLVTLPVGIGNDLRTLALRSPIRFSVLEVLQPRQSMLCDTSVLNGNNLPSPSSCSPPAVDNVQFPDTALV